MANRRIIVDSGGTLIDILHRDSDPAAWIVRRWEKSFWRKRLCSSDWFNDREQAIAYAHEMQNKGNGA